ncbi:MAG: DUF1501 domain-containing protein [Pyrinomonadaceae bacterium]
MKQDRREFLAKSCGALSMAAMASQMRHFGMMSVAAQSSAKEDSPSVPSDYRALVCIFLQGGNDGNNTIISNHTVGSTNTYNNYSTARSGQGLALTQAQLNSTQILVPRIGNLAYALHPNLGILTQNGTTIINNGIHELWAAGKLAAVTNVGTLVTPTTRTTYLNGSVPKPFQLFSHSDQVSQYQSGRSDAQSFTGWGGRISDLRTPIDNPPPGGLIPMVTSIAGAQLFTNGVTTLPLAIAAAPTLLSAVLAPAGFGTPPAGANLARLNAFNALRTQDLNAKYIEAASKVTNAAMDANNALQTPPAFNPTFPNTSIGNQLKQISLLIQKRTDLSINRQIFYAQIGGFDTHTNQITNQGNLLTQLSQGMRAFYDEMIRQGLGDKVTQFTMADFSRTLNPAGTGAGVVGSDHAWGNHMFVVGGGITGSDFYGMNGANGTPFPQLSFNTADDSDNGSGARGRWVPATSVEQYAATLARWFGVPDANLPTVFPKIGNFGANTNLGFMQPPAP